jgi:hypothetical protein
MPTVRSISKKATATNQIKSRYQEPYEQMLRVLRTLLTCLDIFRLDPTFLMMPAEFVVGLS